ncbi:hypothetical protein HanXRQr2_Chr11g0485331 [Helianthus annuus]|nr:hypothetical protein HanXRQr2_Chr11g0485331 [Helianthus annuus]
MRACSFTYEHLSLNASMLLYIRARKSLYAHASLHTSTSASMPACCSTYEHTSLLASLLLYIRARELPYAHAPLRSLKSPYAHAPLHTSFSVSVRAYCFTFEYVSRHERMLFYIRASQSQCESAALHTST